MNDILGMRGIELKALVPFVTDTLVGVKVMRNTSGLCAVIMADTIEKKTGMKMCHQAGNYFFVKPRRKFAGVDGRRGLCLNPAARAAIYGKEADNV